MVFENTLLACVTGLAGGTLHASTTTLLNYVFVVLYVTIPVSGHERAQRYSHHMHNVKQIRNDHAAKMTRQARHASDKFAT